MYVIANPYLGVFVFDRVYLLLFSWGLQCENQWRINSTIVFKLCFSLCSSTTALKSLQLEGNDIAWPPPFVIRGGIKRILKCLKQVYILCRCYENTVLIINLRRKRDCSKQRYFNVRRMNVCGKHNDLLLWDSFPVYLLLSERNISLQTQYYMS